MSPGDQRLFLSFTTSSPSLPYGGLKAIHPRLKVVRTAVRMDPLVLPGTSTCFHEIKLPDYASKEVMEERVLYAIRNCQNSFHRS